MYSIGLLNRSPNRIAFVACLCRIEKENRKIKFSRIKNEEEEEEEGRRQSSESKNLHLTISISGHIYVHSVRAKRVMKTIEKIANCNLIDLSVAMI